MSPAPAMLAVALYAGLNGLILTWLGANAGRVRHRAGVSIGDGGDPRLLRAMRGQANFVEYVPICLVQLGAMAAMGAPVWVLHLLGVALTAGRVLHAWHFTRAHAPGWQRAGGAVLTAAVLAAGSVGLVVQALEGLA